VLLEWASWVEGRVASVGLTCGVAVGALFWALATQVGMLAFAVRDLMCPGRVSIFTAVLTLFEDSRPVASFGAVSQHMATHTLQQRARV
jgi:hypothetical protein